MLPTAEKMFEAMQGLVLHPVLLISPGDAEAHLDIPEAWVQMLRGQREGLKSWTEPWQEFRDLLPGIYDFLQRKVHGVCVLREEGKPPSLLYFYGRETGCYFYQGGPALGETLPDDPRNIWARLPARLQDFYSKLHNGWTTISFMGPVPFQDIEFLSDWTGDMEPEELSRLPFDVKDVIMVFGNGGGDSLCLDLKAGVPEDHALTWWHDDQFEPDLDQRFWARMDDWTCAQLEDVDLADVAAD